MIGSRSVQQDKDVYSVSRLNREARYLLEKQFASVWLEAEISNFKKHSSGHMYLSLKDEQSQIAAVFFSRLNQSCRFEIKDGIKVLVLGKISLYEPRGQYQFFIERMEPKGLGALQLAFEQLKEKLAREGLFDNERKKSIPKFPQTVGVVTSPTGAAIRDILNVINRRFCGTHVILNPVRVQGEGAAEEVAQAIEELNQWERIDVLIVGRGGGSLEDLWAFNEEVVARAIDRSRIPIISAVGHEIDWTICDLVADLRAPTPSAAAELVVQNRAELEDKVHDLKSRMRNAIIQALTLWKETLSGLKESYAFRQPLTLIQQFSQRLDEMLRQLQNYQRSFHNEKKQEYQGLIGQLHALSPLAILARGYSLTFDQKQNLLKDIRRVRIGDSIRTRFLEGWVDSKVEKIDLESEGRYG